MTTDLDADSREMAERVLADKAGGKHLFDGPEEEWLCNVSKQNKYVQS